MVRGDDGETPLEKEKLWVFRLVNAGFILVDLMDSSGGIGGTKLNCYLNPDSWGWDCNVDGCIVM